MNALLVALLLAGAVAQAPSPPSGTQFADLLAQSGAASDQGRYDAARELAAQAVRLATTLNDPHLLALARNRAGLANLYAGHYAEADREFRSAAELSVRTADVEGQAETLGNLANVQFFLGKYADAAALYDQGLQVTRQAGAAAWVDRRRRILLNNQATLYLRLGRDRDALEIYRTLTSGTTLRRREEAMLLLNLGVVYRRLGDAVKALESYDRAGALFAEDRDVDGELGARINRGIVLTADLRRPREADAAFSEALAIAMRAANRREAGHAHLYRGEARLRGGLGTAAQEDFAAALAIARELKTPEEEWKALFGLGRTATDSRVAYLEQAVGVIEELRENIRVPSLRVEFLNDKRDVYDALIGATIAVRAPADIFNLLERSHSRGWRERLGLSGAVQLASVQAALPPRTLLLDYWHSEAGAAVIAVRRERAAVTPIAVDAAAANALLDGLASPEGTAWRDLTIKLAGLLPHESWLQDVDHVIVIPDGATALIPFELLPLRGRLLIEQAAVSYTPTAATLLRPAAPDGWRAPWRPELRAFADPVFATAGGSVEAPPRLRSAETEVRHVASQLAGGATLHVGPDDRKSYLLSPQSAPVLHLATHAFADTVAIERSRIFFSAAEGGNGRADYLFLREAYDLPLRGVELAVLSACETERGPSTRAEGVQSFSRAFLAAGARSTVTTLWRVADRPTADFMDVFYHHLQSGAPRDEALRRAKLRLLQSGSPLADPHYWAAFVLTGDAGRPIPRALPWSYLAAATAAFVILLALVFFVRQTGRQAAPSNAP